MGKGRQQAQVQLSTVRALEEQAWKAKTVLQTVREMQVLWLLCSWCSMSQISRQINPMTLQGQVMLDNGSRGRPDGNLGSQDFPTDK